MKIVRAVILISILSCVFGVTAVASEGGIGSVEEAPSIEPPTEAAELSLGPGFDAAAAETADVTEEASTEVAVEETAPVAKVVPVEAPAPVPEIPPTGRPYQCSEAEIAYIAAVCFCEQGADLNAIRFEASLICNLVDRGGHGTTPYAVATSNWFAKTTKRRASAMAAGVSEEWKAAVRDVLAGNRVTDANEHDCFRDIRTVETNGVVFSGLAQVSNRAIYIPNVSIITNRFGSRYLFRAFPAEGTDPFGVIL